MFGNDITFGQAVIVCLFSLAVVFAVLLLISFLIDLIHWAVEKLSGGKKDAEPVQAPPPAPADTQELPVLAAAAIAAYLGARPDQFVVRSIRRIQDSGWALTGRADSLQ